MASAEHLPDYAPTLSAYHVAFERELRALIGWLPIAEGDTVLDLACGDGVFSGWLAERVGRSGVIVALDHSRAFLDVARAGAAHTPVGRRIALTRADVHGLPFADDSFDLVWCAQSLYSLPDPASALRRMRRVVRPGGMVAVLENDSLHHLLLPWPIEVEVAILQAEYRAFIEESDKPRRFYVGRQLCQRFRAAGLVDCCRRTWAHDRQAPLGPHERAFFGESLRNLHGRVRPHLDAATSRKLDLLLDPDSATYLLDDPDLSVTCIDHVVLGTKPEGSCSGLQDGGRSSS